MTWTIISAQSVISRLQGIAWNFGYCLALGGGVINKGYSEHDLDVVVHTRTDCTVPNAEGFVQAVIGCSDLSISSVKQEQHGPHSIVKLFLEDLPVLELWFLHHRGYQSAHPIPD